jgi:hypothetical protein
LDDEAGKFRRLEAVEEALSPAEVGIVLVLHDNLLTHVFDLTRTISPVMKWAVRRVIAMEVDAFSEHIPAFILI